MLVFTEECYFPTHGTHQITEKRCSNVASDLLENRCTELHEKESESHRGGLHITGCGTEQ